MKVVTQMTDDNDCGLDAIADTFSLYCGRFPCSIAYNQKLMQQQHHCLFSWQLTPFPLKATNTVNLLSTPYSAALPGVVPLKMPELFIFKEIHMYWYWCLVTSSCTVCSTWPSLPSAMFYQNSFDIITMSHNEECVCVAIAKCRTLRRWSWQIAQHLAQFINYCAICELTNCAQFINCASWQIAQNIYTYVCMWWCVRHTPGGKKYDYVISINEWMNEMLNLAAC